MSLKIGIVGFGKIARDQHLPAIAALEGAELVAIASRNAGLDGVACYRDLEAMLAGERDLDAVILCQPPQVRYEAARNALLAGKHVFLEKPPGMTGSDVRALEVLALEHGRSLFASWHSRFASGVGAAKAWIAERTIDRVTITWKENVRRWHPGQDWIWQAGGFGVFDPGINALSILTEIMPEVIRVEGALLETPANREAPISAALQLATASGTPICVELDWRETVSETWDIVVEAAGTALVLSQGGNSLRIDGVIQPAKEQQEYPSMYRHFADLIASGRSDTDFAPLALVADCFLCAQYLPTNAFHD